MIRDLILSTHNLADKGIYPTWLYFDGDKYPFYINVWSGVL